MEYKWDANTPQAFVRAKRALHNLVKVKKTGVLHISDVYVDHADLQFAKQCVAFRVRNTEGKWEATFKTRTEVKNGKAVRREETLSLANVRTLQQALEQLSARKTWKGLDVKNLVTQFALKNKRTAYKFYVEKTRMEMALDEVTILVCGRQLKMKEIELELKQGRMENFEKFARLFAAQTGLLPMQMSKVKTAEVLLNLWKK